MFNEILHFPIISSTHQWLKDRLEARENVCGMVVTADYQTGGKGQGERTWHSAAGDNLLLSLCWCPANFAASRAFDLSVAVSLALIESLKDFAIPDLSIKWPNDIWSGNRKLAGILLSNTVEQGFITHVIISIGLNVNQMDFPYDLPNPVSMRMLTGMQYERNALLKPLLRSLDKYLLHAQSIECANLRDAYKKYLYGRGELRHFMVSGIEEVFVIEGVDEYGRLHLKDSNDTIRSFDLSEVRMLQ